MTITGPDFIALQVANLEQAADFYENTLGLTRAPLSPPGAVVFDTKPIAFAVREPLPGLDVAAIAPRPGAGVVLWLLADDSQALHDRLAAANVTIVAPPADGPFGRMFTFADPAGYAVTIHDKA
jgi:predicted enzyme related to lactoylglutathione lyase